MHSIAMLKTIEVSKKIQRDLNLANHSRIISLEAGEQYFPLELILRDKKVYQFLLWQ